MQNLDFKKIGGVVAIVLIIALIGLYKLGYLDSLMSGSNSTTSSTSTTSSSSNNPTAPITLQEINAVDNSSSVGIQSPPAPNGGKVRSVTMVGPSGVYCSIVQTDGRSYKLIKKAFQPMLINEEAASPKDITTTIQGFINDSWNNGVSSKGDIQLVVASSLSNNPKVKTITDELKKTYNVTTTSSDLEGAGAFKVAVAPQYYNTAFVMDITPTIIRFTYNTGGSTRTIVAKAGSKYYQNNQTKDQALAEIRNVVSQIPPANRQICIVLWAAAEKDLRQGANRYSTIPNYSGSERHITSGLELVSEVKNLTNANMVLDFESMWFSAY